MAKNINENGLSNKEQEVYDFILNKQDACGYIPSVREICDAVGLKSSSSVHNYLVSLEQKGYIKRDPTKTRALEIFKREPETLFKGNVVEIINVPIIGDVAAGTPIFAEQNVDGYCPLPANEFGGRDIYMLRVHGESMIKAGIFDGDQVIVERCETAENGEIVVALIDDSATVKRFYKESGYYRLQPENDEMEPILVDHMEVQGKVIGLMRKL